MSVKAAFVEYFWTSAWFIRVRWVLVHNFYFQLASPSGRLRHSRSSAKASCVKHCALHAFLLQLWLFLKKGFGCYFTRDGFYSEAVCGYGSVHFSHPSAKIQCALSLSKQVALGSLGALGSFSWLQRDSRSRTARLYIALTGMFVSPKEGARHLVGSSEGHAPTASGKQFLTFSG